MRNSLIYILFIFLFSCNEEYQIYNRNREMSYDGGYYRKSRPYRLYSLNKKYFLESIPYDYHFNYGSGYGDKCKGFTKVFSIDDTINYLYTVDRFFYLDRVLLSNNGKSIVYVNNNLCSSGDKCDLSPLKFYKKGECVKRYNFEDLFAFKPSRDDLRGWLYIDWRNDKWLSVNNLYLIDSDVYIITEVSNEVLRFNVNTGNLKSRVKLDVFLNNIKKIPLPENLVKFKPLLETEGIPDVKKDYSFNNALSDYLGAKIVSNDSDTKRNFKYYYIELEIMLNKKGKCLEKSIISDEYLLEDNANQYIGMIELFFDSIIFKNLEIPYHLDKWLYKDKLYIRKMSDIMSKYEKRMSDSLKCKCDELNGFYMPKNLSECIAVLDTAISFEIKERIKSGESFHFGLGTSIRNKWGLWRGTRLSCYFKSKGVYHPDKMSGIIFRVFEEYLKGDKTNPDTIFAQLLDKRDSITVKN